ncbi:MAG: biopolymer transporter ExbD [Bacteroidales bacterium]|nr:biopolymer transporter ExbD [Bacteroidales bacterium]MBR5778386.1 biopolymer transporter ExbD [Bacteroidales bacterium]
MGKKCPELNSGSMSDISFLLLTFFLLVSSINTDMGIPRRLPPPIQPGMVPPEVHKRNIFVVKINSQNNLLFDGQIGDLKALRDRAKEFLSNPQNLSNLPEKETVDVPLLGSMQVSKGVISLQNDRGTSYDMYIQVQNELMAAINEMREDLSLVKFQRSYSELGNEQRAAIDKAIPASISEAEPTKVGGNK